MECDFHQTTQHYISEHRSSKISDFTLLIQQSNGKDYTAVMEGNTDINKVY